jgi:serine/threonine protein kinase
LFWWGRKTGSIDLKLMLVMELCDTCLRDRLYEGANMKGGGQHCTDADTHTGGSFADQGAGGGGSAYMFEAEAMTWQEKIRLGLEIARGMAYLHGHGILHRDLKPGE